MSYSNQIFHISRDNHSVLSAKNISLEPYTGLREKINTRKTRLYFLKNQVLENLSEKRKKILVKCLILICFILFVFLVVFFIVLALIPCSITKCHIRASTCTNHFFYAECICDYGYNGNGRDYCDECGLNSKQPNVRVVGGVEALPNSWPSAAMLITTYKTDYKFKKKSIVIEASFLCGGTLINRKTVLTAAHCILKDFEYEYKDEILQIKVVPNKYYPTYESMYKVFLGVHNRTKILADSLTQLNFYSVEKIVMHEDFQDQSVLNDITILKLSKLVKLDDNIQIACLPDKKWSIDFPIPKTPAWILGWGTIKENGPSPSTLRNARVTVYHSTTCNRVLKYDQKNWESLICAGDISGSKDTCQGDSGGSIFVKENVNNKTKFISAGIVSAGEGCGKQFKPGLYTRIIYYLDWITERSSF
ncbi:unnamed protein product [Brachionus calyciflorus]|uniref:Peptidase S1 domain-containing protein n=1 Tax=Brachionus calyciflorus TaxID=104777 RepID=A0A813LXT8_9BILA|nr:unnamed protein product [Brachionus calyciflorus]